MKIKYIVNANTGKCGNISVATKTTKDLSCDFLNPKLVECVNNNTNRQVKVLVEYFYRKVCKNTNYNQRILRVYGDEKRIEQFKDCLNRIHAMAVNTSVLTSAENVLAGGWDVLKLTSNEIPVESYDDTPFEEVNKTELLRAKIKEVLNNLINFFSEFEFEPNFRFVNSVCHFKKQDEMKEYMTNYFTLSDNAFLSSIKEKMKSYEFQNILDELNDITPSEVINKHLKIYFGSQGTGKTTKAMEEANNNCMVCHSAMLPSDMLEDFDFENGNATFKPSALYRAIEEGKTIVLDEINLLPFESVRFLQSILDGKKCFTYKGNTVNIHDDFKVIGTMNLVVNGGTYALPEPLIDRASDLQCFKLTADMLVSALV